MADSNSRRSGGAGSFVVGMMAVGILLVVVALTVDCGGPDNIGRFPVMLAGFVLIALSGILGLVVGSHA